MRRTRMSGLLVALAVGCGGTGAEKLSAGEDTGSGGGRPTNGGSGSTGGTTRPGGSDGSGQSAGGTAGGSSGAGGGFGAGASSGDPSGGRPGGETGGAGGGAAGSAGTGAAGAGGPGTGGAGAAAMPGDVMPPPACDTLDATRANHLFLSADDSNSMASPVIARSLIESGQFVPPGILRTYEFLNYYRMGYAPAAAGQLAIYPELRADESGSYTLQIGVQSEAPASREMRRRLNITFVLDTSGSMAGEPIDLLRRSVKAVAHNLKSGDVVSMVTWNVDQRVVLENRTVDGPDDPMVIAAADAIDASGGTDLSGGLAKGYELANRTFRADSLNRLLVISDGQANVGVTDVSLIADQSRAGGGDGIYLAGIGVGSGVNDTLMDRATDAGKGAYVYIDKPEEAETMLYARFDEVFDVAAREVQVELRLPWYLQMQRFYGEQWSNDPTQVEPQHLAPGDAMVFLQQIQACDAARVSMDDPIEVVARWQTPIGHEARSVAITATIGELLARPADKLPKGEAIVAYAEALKARTDFVATMERAKAKIVAADPQGADRDLNEIKRLIERYQSQP